MILVTYLVDIVVILKGEILSWSLKGVKRLTQVDRLIQVLQVIMKYDKNAIYVKIDYLMNKNLLKNVTNFQLIFGDQSGLNFPLKIIL